jgi:hypothetical protein
LHGELVAALKVLCLRRAKLRSAAFSIQIVRSVSQNLGVDGKGEQPRNFDRPAFITNASDEIGHQLADCHYADEGMREHEHPFALLCDIVTGVRRAVY